MWDSGDRDGTIWMPREEIGPHTAFDAQVARELAWRIQAMLPEGVTARAVGTQVWFGVGGVLWGGTHCDLGARPRDQAYLANLGRMLLDQAQDVVSTATTVAWPPVDGSRSAMLEPHAEVRDEQLRLWFGEEKTTALRCAPLALRDLPAMA